MSEVDWEQKARDLQLTLHEKAADTSNYAARFRGMGPVSFGPVREAEAWVKAAKLADESFGIHPSHPEFDTLKATE